MVSAPASVLAHFLVPRGGPGVETVRQGLDRARRVIGGDGPPVRPSSPDEDAPVAGDLPEGVLPSRGVPPEDLLDELDELLDGAMRPSRPGWIGHMDPPPTWASVLGATVAAVVNNNMLASEMGPSFARLETRLAGWFAAAFGLGSRSGGMLTAGGTLANLLCLAVARNRALESMSDTRGAALSRLTVLTSGDAHVSVDKAAMVLGLDPDEGVLRVPTDRRGRLDPARVASSLEGAQASGRTVFCLVATAGTTVLGAVDPLGPLARLARARGTWLHVDAAYGGALILHPAHRTVLDGIGHADSVTFNPQKWMYVAKTCAMALFADAGEWRRLVGGTLPYVPDRGTTPPPGAVQVEGTRHADALKLWLSLRSVGRAGYAELVDLGIERARAVANEIETRPGLRLAAPPDTSIVAFRPRECGDAEIAELRRSLLEEAAVFLSLPRWRDERWLRGVLLNPFTRTSTIERLFDVVDRCVAPQGRSAT